MPENLINVTIPCKLALSDKEEIRIITGVIDDPEKTGAFLVVLGDEIYPLDCIQINNQKISDLDDYQLFEWYQSLKLYEKREKEGKNWVLCQEYYFEENGDEYCYYRNDFKKHYTRIEG